MFEALAGATQILNSLFDSARDSETFHTLKTFYRAFVKNVLVPEMNTAKAREIVTAIMVLETAVLFEELVFTEPTDKDVDTIILRHLLWCKLNTEGFEPDLSWIDVENLDDPERVLDRDEITAGSAALTDAVTDLVEPEDVDHNPAPIPTFCSLKFYGDKDIDLQGPAYMKYPYVKRVNPRFDTKLAINAKDLQEPGYTLTVARLIQNAINSPRTFKTFMKIRNIHVLIWFKKPEADNASLARVVLSLLVRYVSDVDVDLDDAVHELFGSKISAKVENEDTESECEPGPGDLLRSLALRSRGFEYRTMTEDVQAYLRETAQWTAENVLNVSINDLHGAVSAAAYAVFLAYELYLSEDVIEVFNSVTNGTEDYFASDCGASISADELDGSENAQWWLDFVVARENLVAAAWIRFRLWSPQGDCVVDLPRVPSAPKNTIPKPSRSRLVNYEELEALGAPIVFRDRGHQRKKFSTLFDRYLTADNVHPLFDDTENEFSENSLDTWRAEKSSTFKALMVIRNGTVKFPKDEVFSSLAWVSYGKRLFPSS